MHALDFFEDILVDINTKDVKASGKEGMVPKVRVEGTPGKHVPAGGFLEAANEFLGAVCMIVMTAFGLWL